MGHPDGGTAIRVLGSFAIVDSDGRRELGGEIPRLVLALLTAEIGRPVTYEALIGGVWGEAPPATARKSLQVHVSNLRRHVAGALTISTGPSGYTLEPHHTRVDAVEFEEQVAEGSSLSLREPTKAVELLQAALDRWNGPAYTDVSGSARLDVEITRLDELKMRAIECLVEVQLNLGRHAEELVHLASLTTQYPYRERLHGLYLIALYRAGRQSEALRHFDHVRRTLGEELGVSPSRELDEIHRRLLEQSPDLDLGAVDRVGRGFRLGARLGERGGGTVYRAVQTSIGRDVALHIRSTDRAPEQPVAALLDHPHLVSIIDAWVDDDSTYVAMPLLDSTLDQALTARTWSGDSVVPLLRQIGSAVQYLHDRDLVHGSVTSDNVLLDGDGNAYLSVAETVGPAADIEMRGDDFAALASLAAEVFERCPAIPRSDLAAELIRSAQTGPDVDARIAAFVDDLAAASGREDRPDAGPR